MTNFNIFLIAMSMIMAFQLTWNGVSSGNPNGPIQFPEGFFCDLICQKWGILTGNTIVCFISNAGEYQRFIARNPAFGMWRFYKVDTTTPTGSLCESSVTGDEFFLNETDITCLPPKTKSKHYHMPRPRSFKYGSDDNTPSVRGEVDVNIPMHAICELATTQVCRQGKVINCEQSNSCCYENLPPSTCLEENMSKFSECYKSLYSVLTSTQ